LDNLALGLLIVALTILGVAGQQLYAPGAAGYRSVRLCVEPQPGVQVRDARFPRAEDFYFKPLNEHVPVYQRPFRVLKDIAIDAAPAGAVALKGIDHLTIKAVLDYQACDDKV
jgi:hypothetical protein